MADDYWIRIFRGMVKIAISLAVLGLFTSSVVSEKYNGQNLNFTIPEGWKVLNESNETKLLLSDDLNSIEIEVVEVPYILTKSIENYGDWPSRSMDLIHEYYRNRLNQTNKGEFGTGSLLTFHPDGVEYPVIGFNYGPDDPIPFDGEWCVTWAKPEYVNKMVGVHALFPGNTSKTVPTGWPHGGPIPEPLFVLLEDFETNFL